MGKKRGSARKKVLTEEKALVSGMVSCSSETLCFSSRHRRVAITDLGGNDWVDRTGNFADTRAEMAILSSLKSGLLLMAHNAPNMSCSLRLMQKGG